MMTIWQLLVISMEQCHFSQHCDIYHLLLMTFIAVDDDIALLFHRCQLFGCSVSGSTVHP